MTLATAVTRNSCPMSISATAKVWPGLPAGTRFPYPVVVSVVKEKNRSCGKFPSPFNPKNRLGWTTPRKR
jgi:hypothetical protein